MAGLILILAFTKFTVTAAKTTWSGGAADGLRIDVDESFSYTATVHNISWLANGAVGVRCNDVYHSTALVGTLLRTNDAGTASGGPIVGADHDVSLGDYSFVRQHFIAVNTTRRHATTRAGAILPPANCELTAEIRYYSGRRAAFEFVATFARGATGVAAAPPVVYNHTTKTSSWASGSLPLGTEFPSWDLPSHLGYQNVAGNSLNTNFAWGPSLPKTWAPQLTGGPLLLFNSSTAAATDDDDRYHPFATVLAPVKHSKAVFISAFRGSNEPPPPPQPGVAGWYTELTHGKMKRIFCEESAAALHFENLDPRNVSTWTQANCTRVAPTGVKACVNGTFWQRDSGGGLVPFATCGWSADVDVAGSLLEIHTSEGSTWRKVPAPSPQSSGDPGLSVGSSGYITMLPPGFQQRVMLTGRHGSSSAWDAFGSFTRALGKTQRLTLEDDILDRRVSYWTDNGAYYCYCGRQNCEGCPDQHTPMGEVLERLQIYHKSLGLKIEMYHLDSGFWHSQNPLGLCNGVTASNWSASPYHFPKGLGVFNTSFQLLFMLLAGPDFKTDLPGGNVYEKDWPMQAQDEEWDEEWRGWGMNSAVAPSESAAFWRAILGARKDDSNLRAVVIDTLWIWWLGFSGHLNTTDGQAMWLDGYLGAASAQGLPVRVDQSFPSDHMASAEMSWSAVVGARCGHDMDTSGTSQMASFGAFLAALRIRPIMDVLWTTPNQPGNYEHLKLRQRIELEIIIATLTTGPIGFGDAENRTNATRLFLASRADGVILKPCFPALRLDSAYVAGLGRGDSAGEVWTAPSAPARSISSRADRRANSFARLEAVPASIDAAIDDEKEDGVWWWNVLVYGTPKGVAPLRVEELWPRPTDPAAAFLAGPSWSSHQSGLSCKDGMSVSSCGLASWSVGTPLLLPDVVATEIESVGWVLLSAAPVLPGGWVLLGEFGRKYVAVSPQRFLISPAAAAARSEASGGDSGADDALRPSELNGGVRGGLEFRVIGAPGERVHVAVAVPAAQSGRSDALAAAEGIVRVIDVVIPRDSTPVTVKCTQASSSCVVVAESPPNDGVYNNDK